MTKKDKAYLAEGLHRLCADLAAIATLFEQPEEATPKPTPAEDPPAAPRAGRKYQPSACTGPGSAHPWALFHGIPGRQYQHRYYAKSQTSCTEER